jgi:hypothetical protein
MRGVGRASIVALLVVAACGGDDDDSSADDGADPRSSETAAAGDSVGDTPGEAGSWVTELEDGSTLSVQLDVGANDAAVAPFEAFRTLTGSPDVTWIVADIEVPADGSTGSTGRFLTFVEPGADAIDDDPSDDTDGVTGSDFVCSRIDAWFANASPDAVDAANADYTALLDGPCGGQTAQVIAPAGQTTTYVLVYDGELPAFEKLMAGLLYELRRD